MRKLVSRAATSNFSPRNVFKTHSQISHRCSLPLRAPHARYTEVIVINEVLYYTKMTEEVCEGLATPPRRLMRTFAIVFVFVTVFAIGMPVTLFATTLFSVQNPIPVAQQAHARMHTYEKASTRHRQLKRHRRHRPSPYARIVGGAPVGDPNKYPFMVALYNSYYGDVPLCGASMVTPSIVLTAAHCIEAVQAADIGRYSVEDNENENNNVKRYLIQPTDKWVHPKYNQESGSLEYDVALIKISTPIDNPYLVSLHRTPVVPDALNVVGWGKTKQGGERANELNEATVKYVSNSECKTKYSSSLITSNMICAADSGVDSCQGDSGGPLMILNQNVQVGIVSWGIGCAQQRYPGVYTRIYKMYNWIEDNICDISPQDCSPNKKLFNINSQGKQIDLTCQDRKVFVGLGKKMKIRDCKWVGKRKENRCYWYKERHCPRTCSIDRCQHSVGANV